MADKISGYSRVGLDVGNARTRAVNRPERESQSDAARQTHQRRDAVEITETATRLKSVEARLANVPDVDRAKVDALRERVESGQYKADPSRIAEKLLRMDKQLA